MKIAPALIVAVILSSCAAAGNPGVSQSMIDVEGWRPIAGDCPSH